MEPTGSRLATAQTFEEIIRITKDCIFHRQGLLVVILCSDARNGCHVLLDNRRGQAFVPIEDADFCRDPIGIFL